MRRLTKDYDDARRRLLLETLNLQIQTVKLHDWTEKAPEFITLPNGLTLKDGYYSEGFGMRTYLRTPESNACLTLVRQDDGWYVSRGMLVIRDGGEEESRDAVHLSEIKNSLPAAAFVAHLIGCEDAPDVRFLRFDNAFKERFPHTSSKVRDMSIPLVGDSDPLIVRHSRWDDFVLVTCDSDLIQYMDELIEPLSPSYYFKP